MTQGAVDGTLVGWVEMLKGNELPELQINQLEELRAGSSGTSRVRGGPEKPHLIQHCPPASETEIPSSEGARILLMSQ